MGIPTLLPGGNGRVSAFQFLARGMFLPGCPLQVRDHGRKLRRQIIDLCPVAQDDTRQILNLGLRLLEVRPLALAQFARVLDALFDPRDFGARLVVARLYGAERVGLRRLIRAGALDLGLRRPQVRERGLHGRVGMPDDALALGSLDFETLQTQSQQLRLKFALLVLEPLIAPCGRRLPLQVADLLVHLLAQIVEAIQVLAGMADSVLRLPSALLVTGYACGLLEERAQIVGPRLDDPGDHPLFDDGIAARAQPGAEEQLRDILAAHLDAVDVIVRAAVATHGAAQ